MVGVLDLAAFQAFVSPCGVVELCLRESVDRAIRFIFWKRTGEGNTLVDYSIVSSSRVYRLLYTACAFVVAYLEHADLAIVLDGQGCPWLSYPEKEDFSQSHTQ